MEDLRAGQPADKRCFFLKISPQSAQVAAYRRTPAHRGRDTHVGFRIATRFPFGLFEKSREVPADGELIIYPAVDPVQLPPAASGRSPGADSVVGRGHGEEFFGLKLMRAGEDPRDVHWRKTAAVGQMVMRERARETRPDVVLTLDVEAAGGGRRRVARRRSSAASATSRRARWRTSSAAIASRSSPPPAAWPAATDPSAPIPCSAISLSSSR